MQPKPPRETFWTERRSVYATLVFILAAILTIALLVTLQTPAYISRVDRANISNGEQRFDVWISVSKPIANGTLHLEMTAYRNGSAFWTNDEGYPWGLSPGTQLDMDVFLPIDPANPGAYTYHFALVIGGVLADQRNG